MVLALLLVGGWFFVARPYLNRLVLDQTDRVLNAGISQIVPVPSIVVPAGTTIPVDEQVINDVLLAAQPTKAKSTPPTTRTSGTMSSITTVTVIAPPTA